MLGAAETAEDEPDEKRCGREAKYSSIRSKNANWTLGIVLIGTVSLTAGSPSPADCVACFIEVVTASFVRIHSFEIATYLVCCISALPRLRSAATDTAVSRVREASLTFICEIGEHVDV
jgi:hypothetical protein